MLATSSAPAEIMEALRSRVEAHRERSRRLVREVFDILAAFSARSLRAVPFKVPALPFAGFAPLTRLLMPVDRGRLS